LFIFTFIVFSAKKAYSLSRVYTRQHVAQTMLVVAYISATCIQQQTGNKQHVEGNMLPGNMLPGVNAALRKRK